MQSEGWLQRWQARPGLTGRRASKASAVAYWHMRSTRVRVHSLLRSRMLPVFSPGLGIRVTTRSRTGSMQQEFCGWMTRGPMELVSEWEKITRVLINLTRHYSKMIQSPVVKMPVGHKN